MTRAVTVARTRAMRSVAPAWDDGNDKPWWHSRFSNDGERIEYYRRPTHTGPAFTVSHEQEAAIRAAQAMGLSWERAALQVMRPNLPKHIVRDLEKLRDAG